MVAVFLKVANSDRIAIYYKGRGASRAFSAKWRPKHGIRSLN